MSSTITIIVKNTALTDKNWGGFIYLASTEVLIEDVDRLRLLSDDNFMADLLSGVAKINDGDYDLTPRVGIGLLQNSNQILTEYYTLVEGEDVLIGNGEILQLHDDKWELEDAGEQEDY
jgi:hypothetical protein